MFDESELSDLLDLDDNQVVSWKLITTNENLHQIEVQLEDGTDLSLLVKTTKTLNQNEEECFYRELKFYDSMLPNLRYFQEYEDLDELQFFLKFLGGRMNSMLVFEHLQGFTKLKNELCDIGICRQILKDLASFHSIPIALSLKDSRVFDLKIKRFLSRRNPVGSYLFVDQILEIIEHQREFYLYLTKIREKLQDYWIERPLRAPFATIIHGNCCKENILWKEISNEMKLINFEACNYASPAEDLIFFLYTSVEKQVLEEHFDSLIEFYHSNFVRVLEECKCDPTPFSLEALIKEINFVAAESQFAKVFVGIFATFASEVDNSSSFECLFKKLLFVVEDFIKREWL